MRTFRLLILMIATILLPTQPSVAGDYIQINGLVDTRTTFSDGNLDIESLVKLARQRGFEAVFFNDHDRMVMEYGFFPFRNIMKKRVERSSINKIGAHKYLEAIDRAQNRFPDMVLVPGSETTPFYYWLGSFFQHNLSAHDHEKRILTVGMHTAKDYQSLPILHNGYSRRYIQYHLPVMIIFIIALILGIMLIREKGRYRIAGFIVAGLSLLFIVNGHPFQSSPFDQYHGNQGILPYQILIDDVASKGGLTFWNYPETRSGIRKLGPIYVNTPPYPAALEESVNYTGFAAIYGDTITATEPGNHWDRVLSAYCRGERRRPVWGIATADFHEDGGSGQRLGDFPTVFLVRHKTRDAVLAAMREGRMYACFGPYPQQIILNEFSIASTTSAEKVTLGEEIGISGHPLIHISLALKQPSGDAYVVRLIRAGKVIREFKGPLPMEIDYEDPHVQPGHKVFYRVHVKGRGEMVSNPIFVSFE